MLLLPHISRLHARARAGQAVHSREVAHAEPTPPSHVLGANQHRIHTLIHATHVHAALHALHRELCAILCFQRKAGARTTRPR